MYRIRFDVFKGAGLKMTKATSKKEGPKKFGVPEKKSSLFPYKRTAFFSGTPNLLGPSYFEAALVLKTPKSPFEIN